MPYFTPPGGAMTAAYGRSLMGSAPMGYYLPNLRRDLNGLGALRFNRSVSRGMYQLPFVEPVPSGRLGQDDDDTGSITVDPTLLFGGIGILALAMLLMGRKSGKKRKKRRLRPQLTWV
jgi:hypothetical protein